MVNQGILLGKAAIALAIAVCLAAGLFLYSHISHGGPKEKIQDITPKPKIDLKLPTKEQKNIDLLCQSEEPHTDCSSFENVLNSRAFFKFPSKTQYNPKIIIPSKIGCNTPDTSISSTPSCSAECSSNSYPRTTNLSIHYDKRNNPENNENSSYETESNCTANISSDVCSLFDRLNNTSTESSNDEISCPCIDICIAGRNPELKDNTIHESPQNSSTPAEPSTSSNTEQNSKVPIEVSNPASHNITLVELNNNKVPIEVRNPESQDSTANKDSQNSSEAETNTTAKPITNESLNPNNNVPIEVRNPESQDKSLVELNPKDNVPIEDNNLSLQDNTNDEDSQDELLVESEHNSNPLDNTIDNPSSNPNPSNDSTFNLPNEQQAKPTQTETNTEDNTEGNKKTEENIEDSSLSNKKTEENTEKTTEEKNSRNKNNGPVEPNTEKTTEKTTEEKNSRNKNTKQLDANKPVQSTQEETNMEQTAQYNEPAINTEQPVQSTQEETNTEQNTEDNSSSIVNIEQPAKPTQAEPNIEKTTESAETNAEKTTKDNTEDIIKKTAKEKNSSNENTKQPDAKKTDSETPFQSNEPAINSGTPSRILRKRNLTFRFAKPAANDEQASRYTPQSLKRSISHYKKQNIPNSSGRGDIQFDSDLEDSTEENTENTEYIGISSDDIDSVPAV